jgi:hypothetical protein
VAEATPSDNAAERLVAATESDELQKRHAQVFLQPAE